MTAADSARKADVINQIASCDGDIGISGTSIFNRRIRSCPAFGTDTANAKRFQNLVITGTYDENDLSMDLRKRQNACGKESLSGSSASPANTSPFKNLEITNLATIDEPSLYQNWTARPTSSTPMKSPSLASVISAASTPKDATGKNI